MNPVYLAAALAAVGWLAKYLVESILSGLKELKEAIQANTAALASFKDEAHETFVRKDDPRLKWVERMHRRHDDETNPGIAFDSYE